jgi:hypothetical protein
LPSTFWLIKSGRGVLGPFRSAATGATTAELMRRAGHASTAAALRYQHATEDRDRALADALAGLAADAPVVPFKRAIGAR